MANSDDQLDAWLVSGIQKKERRANTVQPSSERLVSSDPGNGEAALTSIASWLGTRPKLPIVEFANLSPRTITLTFAEPAVLPDPWVSPNSATREANEIWGITIEHAQSLPQSEGYGWQFSGLTAIGTLADQSRALLNTTRWEVLGVAGTSSWTRTLMLTQVMNQAAEPWSNDHDIWLVGYGETGDKLMNFLSAYHPVHRLHSVEDLGEIEPSDLRSGNATIYVIGADVHTLSEFNSLGVSGVGLIADRVISDKAMFLTERENNAAAIGPFTTNLEIFPNYMPDLVDAMERAWEANARLAADQVAHADFEKFFNDQESTTEKTAESVQQPVPNSESGLFQADVEADATDSELADDLAEAARLFADQESDELDHVDQSDSVTKTPEVDEVSSQFDEDAADLDDVLDLREQDESVDTSTTENVVEEAESTSITSVDPSPDEGSLSDNREGAESQLEGALSAGSEESNASPEESEGEPTQSTDQPESIARAQLTLFGNVVFSSEKGELTGRNAEVLALLKLTPGNLTPHDVSELLWPGDESTGNSARARRARMLKSVRDVVGESSIDNSGEHWILNNELVQTDLELLAIALDGDIYSAEAQILTLIEGMGSPLVGASNWATPYKDELIVQAKEVLSEAVTKAVDQDAFAVAKAAQKARKELEEI